MSEDEFLNRMSKQLDIWDEEEPRDDWWQYQRDYAAAYKTLTTLRAENELMREALEKAAALLGAVYQWVDRVKDSGGATSISGISTCHAMLKSLENNRARAETLVMEPARNALAQVAK